MRARKLIEGVCTRKFAGEGDARAVGWFGAWLMILAGLRMAWLLVFPLLLPTRWRWEYDGAQLSLVGAAVASLRDGCVPARPVPCAWVIRLWRLSVLRCWSRCPRCVSSWICSCCVVARDVLWPETLLNRAESLPETCCRVCRLLPAGGIAVREDLDTALQAVARRPPCNRSSCVIVDL